VEQAERWVIGRIQQALTLHRRDSLWAQMRAGSAALGDAGVTADELLELLELVHSTEFSVVDRTLGPLLELPVVWPDLVRSLLGRHASGARCIAGQTGSVQVLIFDGGFSDTAAHICYDAVTSRLCANLVCRLPPEGRHVEAGPDDGDSNADLADGGDACRTAEGGAARRASSPLAHVGQQVETDDPEEDAPSDRVRAARVHLAVIVNTICSHFWTTL
jgi:hypothetical protein